MDWKLLFEMLITVVAGNIVYEETAGRLYGLFARVKLDAYGDARRALASLTILVRDAERVYNRESVRDYDATLVLAKQALPVLRAALERSHDE